MTERKLVHERWALADDVRAYRVKWVGLLGGAQSTEVERIDAWHRTYNAYLTSGMWNSVNQTSPCAVAAQVANHAHGAIPRLRVYSDGSVEVV